MRSLRMQYCGQIGQLKKKLKGFKQEDILMFAVRENRYFYSHILTYLNCVYSVDCNPNFVYSAKIYIVSLI